MGRKFRLKLSSSTLDMRPMTQQNCCVMLPELIKINGCPWSVLPEGIYDAEFSEVEQTFGFNDPRRQKLSGLEEGATLLARAGCTALYINGSFVTTKPNPNDFDAVWDPTGVDPALLDPIFLDFNNGRANQKARFGGEFLPNGIEAASGVFFVDFFQKEKLSGGRKGIVRISLSSVGDLR